MPLLPVAAFTNVLAPPAAGSMFVPLLLISRRCRSCPAVKAGSRPFSLIDLVDPCAFIGCPRCAEHKLSELEVTLTVYLSKMVADLSPRAEKFMKQVGGSMDLAGVDCR